jgi:hypothetical protein
MSLPGTIVLRPNEFSQPDYSVVYKDPDGRERIVGRMFRNHALIAGERPWFWAWTSFTGKDEPNRTRG